MLKPIFLSDEELELLRGALNEDCEDVEKFYKQVCPKLGWKRDRHGSLENVK